MSLFLSPKENNNQPPENTDSMSTKKREKAMKKSFKTRKESIKKKTMELSVLCDVKACAVIIAPDGTGKGNGRQELDHESKKYQNGCFVSNQNQGPTNQEFLRMIDVKLAQVKKQDSVPEVRTIRSRVLIKMDLMIILIQFPMRCSSRQDMTSCDQTIKNSLCFDTQLDEIQGLDETENFSLWLDSFLDKQPEIQDIQENPSWFDNLVGAVEQENQDIVKFTPNSFFNSWQ
ncbi:Uncharacterized protein Adt_21146 [Abeliophyllum distichum]|uniref:MADS-box domain-containing protein n=1 Tax=Abeliophyllum distichum TaxID=126358 RepID=A0ABD1SYH8_9LAMI